VALPELDVLPEEEVAASLSGGPSLVELLPHALAIAARHARHPRANWRRTRVTFSVSIGVLNVQWHRAPKSVTSSWSEGKGRSLVESCGAIKTANDRRLEERLCDGFAAGPPLRGR
jgi:hypothetical protein